ncbi:AI-2E family transporter [Acuticoccus sp.]|uniref:AI-2E family transporter n=1 Tax=Acuticoccus sp. TaxID=1904378 RepID=UPI003B5197F7
MDEDTPDDLNARPGDASASASPFAPVPRWAGIGIFLILLVGGLAFARPFLVPVVLGTLLTLVFSPVRRVLDRTLPSAASALLIVGALLALLVGIVVLLAGPVAQWIADAPQIATQVEGKLRDLRGAAEDVIRAGEEIGDLASGADGEAQEVVVRDTAVTSSVALLAPAVLGQLVFVLALLFFLLASGDMIYEKIVHVMPTFRDKRQAIRIAFQIERKLSRYLLTITTINAGLGAAVGLAMAAFGMPNPLLFAVVAFLLNYVPYLGAMAGALLAAAVGLVSLDEVYQAALVGLTYFMLTSVTGQFVTPFFVSRQLRLNTVVVFLSVAMCAWLWSVVGMLIATPLLVTIRVFCEEVPPLSSVGDFLSARGAERLDPDEEEEEARS